MTWPLKNPHNSVEKMSKSNVAFDTSIVPVSVETSSDVQSSHTTEDIDVDYGSYHNHIFSDPSVAAYWATIYEKAKYEGRHRFDPSFTYSAREEKQVKRKVSMLYNTEITVSKITRSTTTY